MISGYRLAIGLLAAVAAVLVATIVLELGGRSRDSEAMIATPAPGLPATAAGRLTAPDPNQLTRLAATILARPLFSPGRRPPAVAAAGPGAPAESLPRISGVFVTPAGRRVIFATLKDGKPLVVAEGGHVGAFTVQSIRAGQVTVHGPEGDRVLSPAFDPAAPVPGPAPGFPPGVPSGVQPGAPAQGLTIPGLPGFHLQPQAQGLTGIPGFPGAPRPER